MNLRKQSQPGACANVFLELYRGQMQSRCMLNCRLEGNKFGRGGKLTYIQNPSNAHRSNETAISKALYPESEREASPSTNKIFGSLPEENGERATHNTGNRRSQNKHSLERVVRWVDRGENTELHDEDETDQ
jgi:hypothetical protein